jgi:hypothetical protein
VASCTGLKAKASAAVPVTVTISLILLYRVVSYDAAEQELRGSVLGHRLRHMADGSGGSHHCTILDADSSHDLCAGAGMRPWPIRWFAQVISRNNRWNLSASILSHLDHLVSTKAPLDVYLPI